MLLGDDVDSSIFAEARFRFLCYADCSRWAGANSSARDSLLKCICGFGSSREQVILHMWYEMHLDSSKVKSSWLSHARSGPRGARRRTEAPRPMTVELEVYFF